MTQAEIRARQASELWEEGYSTKEIAHAMGLPRSAIERWIQKWQKMKHAANADQPWHAGMDPITVARLRMGGITTREELIEAWENGDIRPGKPRGIGLVRVKEIHNWITEIDSDVQPPPTKPMIIELTIEARDALRYFSRFKGETASQLVSRLLAEAKAKEQRSN